jgi:S-adenosylmethionine hydrolase
LIVERSPTVTLLTDFGTTDPFVGILKGVLRTHSPEARVIDLTHAIPPQAVDVGSFWLAQSSAYFPSGTIHLAVVDPGVGSERRGVVLNARGHWFVGPDNGLFSDVLSEAPNDATAYVIREGDLRAQLGIVGAPSRTFHARDIFAPAAARLAEGASPLTFCDALPVDALIRSPRSREPHIVAIDHFGNLITSVLFDPEEPPHSVQICDRTVRFVRTYSDAMPGECVVVGGSAGRLEIVVRDGNAAQLLGAGRGTPLSL